MLDYLRIIFLICLLVILSSLLLVDYLYLILIIPFLILFSVFLVMKVRLSFLLGNLVLFSVLFTLTYPPVFGFVLSLSPNDYTDLQKISAIGVRPALVGFLIIFVVLYSLLKPKLLDKKIKAMSFFVLTYLGLESLRIGSDAITSLFNSYIPLYILPLFIVSVASQNKGADTLYFKKDAERLFFYIMILGVIYNLSLNITYSIFRPDLFGELRINGDVNGIQYGEYPGSWKSRISDFYYMRMVGSSPDPIIWGYFCALFSYYFFVLKRKALGGFTLLLLFASGSKGALLFFVFSIVYHYSLKYKIVSHKLLGIISIVFLITLSFFIDSSNKVHLAGLIGGVSSTFIGFFEFLFGFGVGSGGNLSRYTNELIANDKGLWLSSGAESGVGTLFYQLGLVGVALLILIYKRLYDVMKNDAFLYSAQAPIITASIVNAFLQENIINLSILAFVFAFFFLFWDYRYNYGKDTSF